MTNVKKRSGFTLLELVIAIAVWMILTASVIQLFGHTTRETARIIARQDAFENARVAVDSMVVNIQLAEDIELVKDAGNHMLYRLFLWQDNSFVADPTDRHRFAFMFDQYALPGPQSSMYQRLAFTGAPPNTQLNTGNALANGLSSVHVEYSEENGWITITVTAGNDLDHPITLTGKVNVRHKVVNVEIGRGLHI